LLSAFQVVQLRRVHLFFNRPLLIDMKAPEQLPLQVD